MSEGAWLPGIEEERALRRGWVERILLAPLPLAALTALVFGLVGFAQLESFGMAAGFVLYALGLFALAACGLLGFYDRRHDALAIRPGEAGMLPEIEVAHGVLVRVRIFGGCALTGEDRGAMWTEEGRLIFCGRRTSFALSRSAVADHAVLRGRVRLVLAQESLVGPTSVEIVPLFGDRPYAVEIRDTLASWLREGESKAPSQLPPLVRGPGAVTRRSLAARMVREGLAVGLVALLLVLPAALAFHILAPLLLVPLGLLVLFRHRSAWRDVSAVEQAG